MNACLLFLALNGWEVNDPAGALYDAMIAFAEGTLEKPGLADILRSLAISLDFPEP